MLVIVTIGRSHFFIDSVLSTGGCRAYLWRQSETSTESQTSQRWKTQISGRTCCLGLNKHKHAAVLIHSSASHQLINGEMYPPTVANAAVKMSYPPGTPKEKQLAIGQEVFGLLPGLGLYATLWLREHNRVCDILKAEHPTWDDEQLFQTARLIIIGELDTHSLTLC